MKRTNHRIAVDSETGIFWDGERKLQSKAEIETVIRQALNEQEQANKYTNSGHSLFRFAVMKIIWVVGHYIETSSLRFK